VPGANPMAFPGLDALRQAPREQQVDAVVAAFLGGDASAVTRSVLLTGENPLLKAAATRDSTTSAPDPMVAPLAGPPGGPPGAMPADMRPAQRLAQARANAPLPQLRGLPQVLGLALGSPEFQRR